jgi:4-hydroxythreonine-4-phosphate dehydrogenase
MAVPAFVFMLTRGDVTIADARARLPQAVEAGVRHIGFKDIGLPRGEMIALAGDIRAAGAALYLEMVSLDAESEASGARIAVELGVDALMGGTRPDVVEPIIAGSAIRYYPFPGQIVGHPSRLAGGIEGIAASAAALAARGGVHGLDLLAYRFDGDAPALVSAVCRAAGAKPVIVAGSIDCEARIAAVLGAGAAGFTVGTAALDGAFAAPTDLQGQLAHIAGIAGASQSPPPRGEGAGGGGANSVAPRRSPSP